MNGGEGRAQWSGDGLVIGAGPAALAIAAELGARGLAIAGLAPADPTAPWANTYGIWAEEVEALGLGHLLSHRWSDCVSYFGPGGPLPGPIHHGRAYGLFDKEALQRHWMGRCAAAGVRWHRGSAKAIHHDATRSTVTTAAGETFTARLVVDASGHDPVFVHRGADGPVAGQAAYGLVGRYSAPPIAPGQFVFMDYRPDHLSEAERRLPPTFLYAMDLGDGVFFCEETSLALAPPVPFPTLRARLHQRLAHRGVAVREVLHEEFCLFPMNPPLPDLCQRVVGFGGAGGMVHPASGYMVGSVLRRAPVLADAIATALDGGLQGQALAEAAWGGLWSPALRWQHAFFRFGLEKLMRFDEARLRHHFQTFFQLPVEQWTGFLTNTLAPRDLLVAMVRLYGQAPWDVRWGLMALPGREGALLARMLGVGAMNAVSAAGQWGGARG
ncbi:MAG: lycopene beta cyclase [Cyanobacteriota bacterium]